MNCPVCKEALLVLEYQDIEVDYCALCKGVWLDQGELELLLGDADAVARQWSSATDEKGERPCPRCGEKMRIRTLTDTRVEVDVCPAACGLWLDRGEIDALVAAIKPGGEASLVADHLTELFGHVKE